MKWFQCACHSVQKTILTVFVCESIKNKTETIFLCLLWHTNKFVYYYFLWRNYAQKTTAQTGVVILHLYFWIYIFLVAVSIVMTAVSDATVTAVVADCLLFIIIIGCWLPKKKHFSKFVEQTTSDAVISRYIRVHYTLMRVSSFFFHVLHN